MLRSSKWIAVAKHTASNRYEHPTFRAAPILSHDLPADTVRYQVRRLFRIPPSIQNIRVCGTDDVRVADVKFFSVSQVVKEDWDMADLRDFGEKGGYLSAGEDFGVEMEAAGFADVTNPRVAVIKAVCDHGDKLTKASLSDHEKQLLQMFAAETAADYTASMIDAWA